MVWLTTLDKVIKLINMTLLKDTCKHCPLIYQLPLPRLQYSWALSKNNPKALLTGFPLLVQQDNLHTPYSKNLKSFRNGHQMAKWVQQSFPTVWLLTGSMVLELIAKWPKKGGEKLG